ncbi:hypothetical protein IV102_29860 [bacterium]|nr:hypothetical protein [bacterium]
MRRNAQRKGPTAVEVVAAPVGDVVAGLARAKEDVTAAKAIRMDLQPEDVSLL